MKIVFLGDLRNDGNSGAQRYWAMQQCGAKVYALDKQNYPSRVGRLSHHIARLTSEPGLLLDSSRLGSDLVKLCDSVKPDIVWLEWPRELGTDVLKKIKIMRPQPFLISFQDDNPWGKRHNDRWMWNRYFELVPFFDLHMVKRMSDIQQLRTLGARDCRLWKHGIFSPLFHPPTLPVQKRYPVSFVGTCMDNRAAFIRYLLENDVPIHVFGNRWNTHSDLPHRYPENFHPAVEGKAYANTIRGSQICLGLVSHSNYDEWTMRTYEVPGCAAVLLAERTPTHENMFVENQEAVFFTDAAECLKKIRYLLPATELCDKIGRAAFEKFHASGWTLEARMHELLHHVDTVAVGPLVA